MASPSQEKWLERLYDGNSLRYRLRVPELLDRDFLHHLADAQALGAHAHAALAADRNGDAAARHAAAAALVEDVLVVQAAAPALEVADLVARIARVDGHASERLDLDEHACVGRQLLRRVEHVGRQVARVRHLDLEAALRDAHVHLERRRHCRDAQVHGGLALADFGQELVRRVVQAHELGNAADLDLAELRVLEALPRAEHAPLVALAVQLGELEQVLAREVAVEVDEALLPLDSQAREQIPQLARVGDGAARVIDEVGDVAVDRLLRLVDELLEAAHHRVAADLLAPFADLPIDGEVLLVHLVVGRVAERSDVAAAEGVEVEPREDVGVRGGPFDNGARLRLARAEGPGTELLRLGLPAVREVAVQVDVVVGEVDRVRHVRAVEVLDRAFGPELVVRPRILEPARQHDAGQLGVLDEFTRWILAAHRERYPVAVDVTRDPARRGRMRTAVARVRAHEAAVGEHGLGAVGRHARQHVEQDALQPLLDVRRQIQLVLAAVKRDDVFRDGERHARAAHLDRVHVAVDPRGRARAVGISSDLEQPEVASLDALADAFHAHERGIRARPVLDDARQLFVAEVAGAEWTHGNSGSGPHYFEASERSPMMPSARKASASPAMRPPPTSDVVSMSCGWPLSLPALVRATVHCQIDEKMPPNPYQNAVGNSTKPPRLDAYGPGRMIVSMMKSATFVPVLRSFHA